MTRLGDIRVAVDVTYVTSVEPPGVHDDALDVATHLRVVMPPGGDRRLVRLSASPGALLFGEQVTIVELPLASLYAVPELVAGHLHDLAIDGLASLDDGFAYLLSPRRMRTS
jgi:hypothetical protein